MPRKPDFFAHLDRSELEALEAFARQPSATIDSCHEWLLAKGITASRSAVARWKNGFDELDRMSAAAELADVIATADQGTADVAGAVSLQIAQRLQAAIVKGGDDLKAGDLLKMSMAINAVATTQQRVEKLKAIQRDAVKAAELAAKSGKSGVDVVALIKQKLGITP